MKSCFRMFRLSFLSPRFEQTLPLELSAGGFFDRCFNPGTEQIRRTVATT